MTQLNDRNALTIEEMLTRVPPGEARLFERTLPVPEDERFLSVHQNWDTRPGRLDWRNQPLGDVVPWFGARAKPRVGLENLPAPDLLFSGPAKDVVDFYSWGVHVFFLSERLMEVIERLDPGSMEARPAVIRSRAGAQVPVFMAMPGRHIDAVDTARTNVLVSHEDLGSWFYLSVKFPDGVAFRERELAGVHHFTDRDLLKWYWSRELIEAAKAGGVRGVYTLSPSASGVREIDRF